MSNKFYRRVLKNGMTVIFEKRATPVVSVSFAAKVGGQNESAEEKGISHYIEHMLFKGTPKRNYKQISGEIEKNGGITNAFTGETVTAFWCKMPSNKLNIALDVLSDIVKNPLFDQSELDKERKVIIEEIKMNKDNPHRHAMREIFSLLYKEPFGTPVIGSEKTLNSITRQKIVKRFKETYCSENMILTVVGDADFEKLCAFCEKNFEKSKSKVKKNNASKRNAEKIESRKGVDQANLIFAYHIPDAKDDKSYAAFLLNSLLTEGASSRLFDEIREKRNLAYSVGGFSDINKDFAFSAIHVGVKKEHVQEVKKLILKEFEKVSKSLDEKELSGVREQVIGNHYISLEDSQNQMVALLLHELNGEAKELYDFEKKIRAVKLSDVKKLAKIKKYSFFALVPE